jgi:hypothetical protein
MEDLMTSSSLILIVALTALLIGTAGFAHLQFAHSPGRHALTGSAACLIVGFIALAAALIV